MTTGGWIIMIGMLIMVWSTAIWSYARLLRAPREDREHFHIHDNV